MVSLFEKLAAEEQKFFNSEFISPVIKRQPIRIRISGIELTLKVLPEKFQGWGVFKTTNKKTAEFVREPTGREKKEYLELYPRFNLIICKQGKQSLGLLAHSGDNRLKIEGIVPIRLAEETRLFSVVNTRSDGHNFWFEGTSNRHSKKIATALRDYLLAGTKVEDISISGISPEEILAYQFAYQYDIESKKDHEEERIKSALKKAGANFRSYVERGSTYTVEYSVDGHNHRSTVDKKTLEIASSGICLSGQDRLFDLQSLVTVMREAQNTGLIYRV
jgi:hypothetical protein